ncbi:MAG TPA: LysR family transcriptional regulator [Clostridia bacterium]|nr:LysR family transcriptional regulator [Clostridia bacterium]
MHIEYLKYFFEVASVKSISKVANSCHISQPALSQQIQRLEDSLGFKLLERSNKGVELTEAGQIVEKYAKNLIKAYDNMVEDLAAINKKNCTMRIEACPTMATYALPCTVFKIKEEFPNYNYCLISSMSEEVEHNILADACDVGFVQGMPSDQDLVSSIVGTDRMVFVASSEYNIKSEISLNELVRYPLIMMHEKFQCRKQFNEMLKEKGIDLNSLNVLFSLDSTESVKSSVLKGHGLSLLPYISIKKEMYNKQLKEVKVKDFEIQYEIYIVYKRDKGMNKGTREFIQFLKKIGEKSFC